MFNKKLFNKTEHRKGAAGYRQGAERVPSYALLDQTGPVCLSAAPGRCLATSKLLKGALRLQISNIYRASSGLRWICDHGRRRNEFRKGPARSRNPTASRRVRKSYGARWICESPFSEPVTRGYFSTYNPMYDQTRQDCYIQVVRVYARMRFDTFSYGEAAKGVLSAQNFPTYESV